MNPGDTNGSSGQGGSSQSGENQLDSQYTVKVKPTGLLMGSSWKMRGVKNGTKIFDLRN